MPKPRRRQPRKSKSRKPKAPEPEEWYSIRSIVDERVTKGHVEYLVDWDDHPETGERYSPTWSREVTEAALQEWETRGAPASQDHQQQPPLQSIESQDSQPPRPASWRRTESAIPLPPLRRRAASTDLNERPSKAPRIGYTVPSSEEPVPSITSLTSLDTTAEAQATHASKQEELARPQTNRLTIEIKENPGFDSSEYHSVANTQTSVYSSQSLAEQEEAAARIVIPTTIPDSQEPSGQTWSQPHISGESAITSPNEGAAATSCVAATPHIPSRQPDHPELADSASQSAPVTATVTTPSISLPPLAPQKSTSPRSTLAPQTRSESSPAFLTQPSLQATFPVPDSSLPSQVLESPQAGGRVATSREPSRTVSRGSPDSQSAQVVNREFTFPADNSAASSTGTNVERHRENSTSGTQQRSHGSSQGAETSELLAPPSNRNMEETGPEEPAPPAERTSDMDEINLLFNLGGSPDNGPALATTTPAAALANSANTMTADELASQPEGPSGMPENPALDYQATVSGTATDGTQGSFPPTPLAASGSGAQPQPSATQRLQDIVMQAFGPIVAPISEAVMPDVFHGEQGQTVTPAEITRQTTIPLLPSVLPVDTMSSIAYESPMGSMPMGSISMAQTSGQAAVEPESNIDVGNQNPTELLITLPFQSNVRPLYDDTLLDDRRDITTFGRIFSSEIYEEPDDALVKRIDGLFGRLQNLCDYPQDIVGTTLSELPPLQQAKYSLDASAKFSFVFELFQGITKDTKILLVARSSDLLRLLCHLTDMLGVEYTCDAIGKKGSNSSAAVRVTLVLPDDKIDASPFDVVIGFDHAFAPSRIAKDLSLQSPQPTSSPKRPLVLFLVTTHSIEHIYPQVPQDLPRLERMNALLSGIVHARQLVNDPIQEYPKPHSIARQFFHYLNGEDELLWEPIEVPDFVLDVYANSQAHSQMPIGDGGELENRQKRKLDETDDTGFKRMRHSEQPLVETNEPPLPDSVRLLLGTDVPEGAQVKISIAALEGLAEKHAELERQIVAARDDSGYKETISRLEKQVKENETTHKKTFQGYRGALEERSRFEAAKGKSDRSLQEATELAKKESDKAQKKIAELEAVNARLMTSSEMATSESLLKEAQGKVVGLEQRLGNAHGDVEYVKNLYQEATSSTTALRAENTQLNEQNAELRKQASENLANIHRIQADATTKELLRRTKELQTQVNERERELDQAREELRQLRSGRRETRQVSIPRSPAMGVMSPRTGRIQGGSGSRGTSPARAIAFDASATAVIPAAPFLPGNGRFNHLRD